METFEIHKKNSETERRTTENKMMQFQPCLRLLMLMVCCDFGAAQMNERFGWNPRRSIIIDRFASNIESSGYFVLPQDKTAFTVDHPVWLHAFDITKVFLYDPNEERAVHNVPVKVKFVKIANHTLGSNIPAEVIFVGRAILNSTHETRVKVPAKVPLHPGFIYEIRLKMPEKVHLMYNEFLDIRDYKINRFFGKTITVSFYLHNPIGSPPPNGNDHRRKISHGMVKRIQLIYSWF